MFSDICVAPILGGFSVDVSAGSKYTRECFSRIDLYNSSGRTDMCVCVCWFGDRINFACDHVCLGCAPVSQYEWCIDVKLFRCLCMVGIVVLNKYEAIF